MSDFPSSSSSSSSFLLFLMIITFVTLSQPILAQSQQTTKYETGAENRLDVLLESLYDAANATSSEMIPNELTVLPSEIEESYSLDGLKQILSFTPSAERTSGIVMTDVANILRDAESYSIERIFMLLTNLRDSQSAVDTEAARVSKAQFEKCNAALKYYESATEALSERVERAKSSEARYEPKNTDTHLMDKSLKDLTRRIETIDTVTSEYDRVAGIHRKSSMNVLKDAIEQIEKLSNVASASVHGPRDGESVESLERDMAATGGGEEELLLDEIPIVSLLELSSPSGIKPSNTLRSIREMQDNLFEVQDSLMKDTRDLTNVDDVVVPPVTAPVPSQREIEDIVDSDEKSSKVRLEIDKKLLKELLRRKEHLEMLCESLNETSRRFERDLNMSSEFGIVPETFPHLASHMLIADLGRLAEYVQNHTSLVVENETMSDAFLRAVPLISKEIRDAVISSSPGKEALRSVNVLICIHQVRSGDSLPSLAEKYDLTLRDLKDANPQLPWKLRHENGYPDINTTIFVPFDHYKPARCEKLYPCAISPSPVCSHGGIAARGPEGTKPGFGWLHTPLGRIAAGWAADAATGSAFEDWDGDSGLMSKAEKSALERVAEAGESTARLFNSVRDNVKASGKDVIATSGLTPSPLSGMPVDSVKQLDVDMKKGPVPHDILAADSNLAFLELQRSSSSSSKSRLKSKNQRKKLRGSNHDVLSKGDSVWVYGASAKHWLSGTVASTHEDGTYEITYPDGSISERVPIEGISTSEPSKPVADTSSSSSMSRIGEIDISVQCDVTSGPESPSCPEVEECDFSNAGDGCEIVTEYELMGMMCCAKPCNFKDTNGKSCGGLVSTTDSNVDDVVVTGIFDGALCDDVHEPCPSENCHGHGSVVEDNKGKKHCACDDGYVGESCEKCASSHYEEEAIPSEHNRGYDKTRKICRRCAPFITVNRADGHQYDEGATLETSCDVAAQVVTSVGGSGSGLWAQRDKLKVQYADLFLSLEGADLTSSARVEIHEFNVGSFPSGELVTDNALAIGYFNNTSDKGWSRFTFLPYAPISAGIDIVLALRLKDTSTKIEWHRDDKVDLSDKEAKAYMHCGGSWDEAEVLDGMDQPQFSYRLIACSG